MLLRILFSIIVLFVSCTNHENDNKQLESADSTVAVIDSSLYSIPDDIFEKIINFPPTERELATYNKNGLKTYFIQESKFIDGLAWINIQLMVDNDLRAAPLISFKYYPLKDSLIHLDHVTAETLLIE